MKQKMVKQARENLTKVIIPFWRKLKDEQHGGFYGYVDYDLQVNIEADKGCILNSRILWFFSNAYDVLHDPALLQEAEHAYKFMKDYCIDWINGGVYWSVTYDGKPKDDTKHTYNQAFALYALASYYGVSGSDEAKELAYSLMRVIEEKCRDTAGYMEAFDVNFSPVPNEKLSENGVEAQRTMNTLLHVMEAYTELYRVTKDSNIEKKLTWIINLWSGVCFNKKNRRQEVFFTYGYKSLLDIQSYGHDIETSWLLGRSLDVLGNMALKLSLLPKLKILVESVYEKAYVNHSLMYECVKGVENTQRHWWVQAEAVVGFLNAYQEEPEKTEYMDAAADIFGCIQDKVVDSRGGSEWFAILDEELNPVEGEAFVQPWKCPYHNGRMCLEIIKRLD